MRLFLASDSLPNAAPLAELLPIGARIAVVANAVDLRPAGAREAWLRHELEYVGELGPATELDLRLYFSRHDELARRVAAVDFLWVTGGNTFRLRDAMRRSGLDQLIRERVANDALVYGGFSAGACVCTPSLRGIELVDDVAAVERPTWEGLGLVDFRLVPHFDSEHPEAAANDSLIADYERQGVRYRTLRNGQALVVRGSTVTLIEL